MAGHRSTASGGAAPATHGRPTVPSDTAFVRSDGRRVLREAQGRTPHSARHAMGRHIIAKTGTIAAVQKQLGYRQAAYAMQYARTTTEELAQVLDDR